MKRIASLWRAALLAVVVIVAVAAGIVWWQASRAEREARRQSSQSLIPISFEVLDRALPVGVEPMGAPAAFRDAAVFQGHFFLGGPLGLAEYDARGVFVRRFRIGMELPPAPIVGLTVGVLASASEPQLLIGTSGEGVIAFDGREFRQARANAAPYRKVTAILSLAGGRLLVGTEKSGLLVFDGRQLTLAHPGFANVPVTALGGAEGDVWVGTLDRGVLHWRAGEIDRFDEARGLPDARVLSIAASGDRAFVGTAVGIAEFERGRFARALGDGLFATALTLRGDTLWVATLDRTIARVPIDARPSRGVRPLVHDAPSAVQRLVHDGAGLYAIAEDAVYAVDARTAALGHVLGADRAQLSDRNVSALAVDPMGRLWVGYFDRGLDILDAKGERLSHVETDRVFCVNRIVPEAEPGVTAVATANGLVFFDSSGHQRQVLGRADGLIADHVTDLVVQAGRMTVATPAGLTILDADGSRSLYAFQGLVNNHVYALGVSGRAVLAGTLGGASVLVDGVVHASYTTANSALTHNWITAAARVGTEWFVGTYGGGLFRLDEKETWHRFADATGAIEINPNAMAVTDAHVFAGTLSSGLLVYDRRSSRWSRFDEGLPSRSVTAIAADRGVVYLGTDNGIVRVEESHFPQP